MKFIIGEPIPPPPPTDGNDEEVRRLRREVEGALHEMFEHELANRVGLPFSAPESTCDERGRTTSSALRVLGKGGQCGERVHGREESDDLSAFDDDGRAVLVLCHVRGHFLERSIRAGDINIGRHGFIDGGRRGIDVPQRFDEM